MVCPSSCISLMKLRRSISMIRVLLESSVYLAPAARFRATNSSIEFLSVRFGHLEIRTSTRVNY